MLQLTAILLICAVIGSTTRTLSKSFLDVDEKCIKNKWHFMSNFEKAQACLASLDPCLLRKGKFRMLPDCPNDLVPLLESSISDLERDDKFEQKRWKDEKLDPYEGDAFSLISRLPNGELRVEMMQATVKIGDDDSWITIECKFPVLRHARRMRYLHARKSDVAGFFLPPSAGGPCSFLNFVPLQKATASSQRHQENGGVSEMIHRLRLAVGYNQSNTTAMIQVWPAYTTPSTGRPAWLTYLVKIEGDPELTFAYRLRNTKSQSTFDCSATAKHFDFSGHGVAKFGGCEEKWWKSVPAKNWTHRGIDISLVLADVWKDEKNETRNEFLYKLHMWNHRDERVAGFKFRLHSEGGISDKLFNIHATSTPDLYIPASWFHLMPHGHSADVQVVSYGPGPLDIEVLLPEDDID